MKKFLCLFLLTIILLLGNNVYAAGVVYYLSNSEMNYFYYSKSNARTFTVQRGSIIYVTVVIDNEGKDYNLKSGKTTLRWDENVFQLVNSNGYYKLMDYANLIVSGNPKPTDNKIVLNFTNNSPLITNKSRLFQFQFKVLDNASAGTYKIYQQDDEDTLSCIDNASQETITCSSSYYTEIRYKVEGSTNSLLSDIKIDGKTINNFNKNTTTYNVETSKEKIQIEATKDDNKSTISGDVGERTLDYGVNKFSIKVVSESGSERTYNLNVTRLDNRSKVNTLKSLEISDTLIKFSPDILNYEYTVKNEIKKVTVKAALTDSKSKMGEDFTNKEIALSEGVNKIVIKVTAENGDEKTYVVNIIRELSGNNTLKEIAINNKKIKVQENVFDYSYEVEYEVSTVNINATPSEKTSLVAIDKKELLEVGDNYIKIIVTAPNGNEVTYHVTVTRKRKLSEDSLLKSLVIDGYNFELKDGKFYYDLKIKDEEALNIVATPSDEKSTVVIEGNKDLINGSIIKVNVKAEDGTITRYFINIEKDATNWTPIIIILCLVAILVFIVIKIFKTKKKQDNESVDKLFTESTVNNDEKKERRYSDENDDEIKLEENSEEVKNASEKKKSDEVLEKKVEVASDKKETSKEKQDSDKDAEIKKDSD